MKTTVLLAVLGWVSCASLQAATSPHYINRSPANYFSQPPQIDATSFENRSSFTVFGAFDEPFETYNTLNFTNTASGRLHADPGVIFDHSYATGRGPMANWVNRGLVSAPIYLQIQASNIVNANLGLGVGARGALLIEGDNVNLSRSGLYSGPRYGTGGPAFGFSNIFAGFGYPPLNASFGEGSIKDEYWGIGTNSQLLAALDLALPAPSTPVHNVAIDPRGFGRGNTLPGFLSIISGVATNYAAFAFTNIVEDTNIISVVFVPTNAIDPGLLVDVRWTRNLDGGDEVGIGGGSVAMVRLGFPDFDPLSQTAFTNYVYVEDYLAFQSTNRFLAPNFSSAATAPAATRRPNTSWLSRSPSGYTSFEFGETNNITYDPALFNSPTYNSNRVNITYAAHSGRLVLGENLLNAAATGIRFGDLHWSGLPINDITNFAGRIEIKAGKLNLDNVRVHAESGLVVQTDDLQGDSLPLVDSPLLSYDMRSTRPTMTVSNLVPASANRIIGTVSTYSAIWENLITNALSTNYFKLHFLFVDHSLSLTQQVVLQDLKLRGNHIVIADLMQVGRDFLIEAPDLTIAPTGTLLNGTGADLAATNFIGVLNFTNAGHFLSSNQMILGSDRSQPFSNIVNYGFLSANGIDASSDFLLNSNVIYASDASLHLNARDMRLLGETNRLESRGLVILSGGSLYASNSLILAGSSNGAGGLVINFTNSVADDGPASSNFWFTTDGFTIARAPMSGDLPYTTIISRATNESEVVHILGAVDHGVSPLGYQNNLFIGRLVLDGSSNTLFRFSPPPGASNTALYVDYLELQNYATNWLDSIVVEEGCKLYFANANISPKRDLNHSSEDRLRWVSTFAGPYSTSNYTYTVAAVNYPVAVNLALALLSDIDSDNDGVANQNDPTPIWIPQQSQLLCTLTNFGNRSDVPFLSGEALVTFFDGLSTNVATNTIEYSLDLINGPWLVLTNIVLPTVFAVPPQSLPFGHMDLEATNKVRNYRMNVRVTDP